jgi:hypothetical protein
MRILAITAIICGLVVSAAWAAFLGLEMSRAVHILGGELIEFGSAALKQTRQEKSEGSSHQYSESYASYIRSVPISLHSHVLISTAKATCAQGCDAPKRTLAIVAQCNHVLSSNNECRS